MGRPSELQVQRRGRVRFRVAGGWLQWYLLTVCGSGGSVEKEGTGGDYLCSRRFIQAQWSKQYIRKA